MDDAMARTERRKLITHANLLAAGGQQISTVGLGGLSIRAMTEQADVALGTFYNHFTNREELIDEVLAADQVRTTACIIRLQSHASDVVERTVAVVAACVARAVREPGWAKLAAEFWSVGRWPTESPSDRLLLPEVQAGVGQGLFDVENVALAVVGVRDLLGGLLRRYASDPAEIADASLLDHAVSTV
jgi:AcrR family transcriptional regulator